MHDCMLCHNISLIQVFYQAVCIYMYACLQPVVKSNWEVAICYATAEAYILVSDDQLSEVHCMYQCKLLGLYMCA